MPYVVKLTCLVDAVARSDRDDRTRGDNKLITYRILYSAREATQKVSFASYGRGREEARRGQRRGIRCGRREAQYRTWRMEVTTT